MADAKIILFNSPSKQLQDGTYPVVLRITHDRKRKYLSLGRHCLPDQWNNETCRFRKNYPEHRKENDLLLSLTFISDTNLRTVQTGLLSFVGQFGQREWGPTFASIALTVIPTLLIYLFLNNKVKCRDYLQ